jgi:hypothetical protein
MRNVDGQIDAEPHRTPARASSMVHEHDGSKSAQNDSNSGLLALRRLSSRETGAAASFERWPGARIRSPADLADDLAGGSRTPKDCSADWLSPLPSARIK